MVVLLVMPFAELIALRQWRIAIELDQARRAAAELATTRERLRLAEDLHDILGHALEVVSLKSELAARLLDDPVQVEGRDGSRYNAWHATLCEDVRALAHGNRPTRTWTTELAGARQAAGLRRHRLARRRGPGKADRRGAW